MKFHWMAPIFPDQKMWGAIAEPFTFVVIEDKQGGIRASAKLRGMFPHQGKRHDIGEQHASVHIAMLECARWYSKWKSEKSNGGSEGSTC